MRTRRRWRGLALSPHVEPCSGGIFEKVDDETEELLAAVAAGVEEPAPERRGHFEGGFESLGEDAKEKLRCLGYFRQRSSTESWSSACCSPRLVLLSERSYRQ
eukprot:6140722-Pyramimonas_sp.AAC.1